MSPIAVAKRWTLPKVTKLGDLSRQVTTVDGKHRQDSHDSLFWISAARDGPDKVNEALTQCGTYTSNFLQRLPRRQVT